ncbi:hypothetical protein E2C01_014820 [Portunus trituberculatus]|uniref:Uncharacterized protein n=1 Tax=Portunus trituberculatus TaxID=210409 RepID=A0A5B7DK31_PORTR|nr:hypothetical protein [Portunus trituberculatus]
MEPLLSSSPSSLWPTTYPLPSVARSLMMFLLPPETYKNPKEEKSEQCDVRYNTVTNVPCYGVIQSKDPATPALEDEYNLP